MKKIFFLKNLFVSSMLFFSVAHCMDDLTNDQKKLVAAIEKNDVEEVRNLVTVQNINLDFQIPKINARPIEYAFHFGNPEIFKILRRKEMTENEKDFFQAIDGNDIDKIKELIADKKVFGDTRNTAGETALIVAVKKRNSSLVQTLLDLKFYDINARDLQYQTALTHAIDTQNETILNLLLQNTLNIDIDKPDRQGYTPLMHAVKTKNITIIMAILSEIPNTLIINKNQKNIYDLLNEEVYDKPLNTEIHKLLNTAQEKFSFYHAVWNNNIKEVHEYLKKEPYLVNIPILRNPLLTAIRKGNKSNVATLITRENINLRFKNTTTPLLYALEESQGPIVKFLIEKGANPNLVVQNKIPLLKMIEASNLNVLDALQASAIPVDVNIRVNLRENSWYVQYRNNVTPLMAVAQSGSANIVEKLLALGANPTLTAQGKTALEMAQEKKEEQAKQRYSTSDLQQVIDRLTVATEQWQKKPEISDQRLINSLQKLCQALDILIKAF